MLVNTKKILTFLFPLALAFGWLVIVPVADAASGDFTMSWSCDSYVPLSYEGKALPSRGSNIKVVVLPTKLLSVSPDALSYRWLLDGRIQGWAQGKGKTVFPFRADKWGGDYHAVESQVLDAQGNIIYQHVIYIPISDPQIIMKTPASVYAVKENLASQTGQDLTITAEPFFFHVQKLSELSFKWIYENFSFDDPGQTTPNIFLLKIPKANLSKTAERSLEVAVNHKTDNLQMSSAKILLQIK